MKVTIKKFMELQNVSFSTPVKIEAGHDVGKSTIYRAVLFAITGKDTNGNAFDGCIYPKKANTIDELQVEVQIEQNGITFCRIAKGAEKRVKGSDDSTLKRSVTSSYGINNDFTGGKSAYDAKIEEVFGNFQLFCNPDYFKNLDKDKKRSIFASLVKIDKSSYFDGIEDKTLTNGKLSEQRKAIAAKQANLVEFGNVQQPETIEVIDYTSQIAELQAKRNAAMPTLTDQQEAENLDINLQVSQLEKSVFIPENLKASYSRPNEPELIDLDKLRKEYSLVQISEPETLIYDTQIQRVKQKIEQIKSLNLQIENYAENVKNSKCTVCQVCFTPCEFKTVEIKSLDELQSELNNLLSLEKNNTLLEKFESEKIDYLRSFEDEKSDKLLEIKQKGDAAKLQNELAISDYSKNCMMVDAENADIARLNAEISTRNNQNAATYQSDKSTQVQALKSQLHEREAFNPFEFDDKIELLARCKSTQQRNIDAYNKAVGAFEYAQQRIIEITAELQEMKSVLIGLERNIIAFEATEKAYYTDFENKINSEMPENVKVRLFEYNTSNDGYKDVFEIEFNGSVYAGNGYTIAFYIFLCNWFQSKFEKSLPIFIDEAIILNEKLYSNVKNTVILMRNDEMKTLKITENENN